MTIHLPEELARFIHDAVRSGRYAREDDVIRDAVSRLRQALQEADEAGIQDADSSHQGKALTKQELHRHLTEIGLMDQAPDPGTKPAKPSSDPTIDEEEVISERMIRERLIEWLTGFL
jgi:putative addiction module CopG family antidote